MVLCVSNLLTLACFLTRLITLKWLDYLCCSFVFHVYSLFCNENNFLCCIDLQLSWNSPYFCFYRMLDKLLSSHCNNHDNNFFIFYLFTFFKSKLITPSTFLRLMSASARNCSVQPLSHPYRGLLLIWIPAVQTTSP